MTSSMGESATTILCSCKQTRFHIENPVYQEVVLLTFPPLYLCVLLTAPQLDIEGLIITVTSAAKPGVRPKGKVRGEGLEILSNATLKLKAGVHYALIGRNGTGKSSKWSALGVADGTGMEIADAWIAILKAVAEKLIPGIPIPTRIAILQQTSVDEQTKPESCEAVSTTASRLSVLEEVIEKATSRNELQCEIDGRYFLRSTLEKIVNVA